MNYQAFWDVIDPKFRHVEAYMDHSLVRQIVARFEINALDHVPLGRVCQATDWGCGGGILTARLPDSVDIEIIDICKNSLDRTADRFHDRPNRITKTQWPDQWPTTQPQLLWCYSVIHHLPTLQDWYSLVTTWVGRLEPRWICLSTKVASTLITCTDYLKDFCDALILDEETFVGPFEKLYRVKHYYKETVRGKPWTIDSVVWEKR